MPKDAQYPSFVNAPGDGGTLPNAHRDTSQPSKMGGLAKPSGYSRPSGPANHNPSHKGSGH